MCLQQPRLLAVCCLALMAALVGCRAGDRSANPGPSPSPTLRTDVTVTEISLGRALETNRRVAQPREDFAPADTVYASIVTEGSARRVVSESSLAIAPSGVTVSEFHVSRPEGLPRGRYQVEILLDGASAGKRGFSVR